jgi:hypothetical protein
LKRAPNIAADDYLALDVLDTVASRIRLRRFLPHWPIYIGDSPWCGKRMREPSLGVNPVAGIWRAFCCKRGGTAADSARPDRGARSSMNEIGINIARAAAGGLSRPYSRALGRRITSGGSSPSRRFQHCDDARRTRVNSVQPR